MQWSKKYNIYLRKVQWQHTKNGNTQKVQLLQKSTCSYISSLQISNRFPQLNITAHGHHGIAALSTLQSTSLTPETAFRLFNS